MLTDVDAVARDLTLRALSDGFFEYRRRGDFMHEINFMMLLEREDTNP